MKNGFYKPQRYIKLCDLRKKSHEIYYFFKKEAFFLRLLTEKNDLCNLLCGLNTLHY